MHIYAYLNIYIFICTDFIQLRAACCQFCLCVLRLNDPVFQYFQLTCGFALNLESFCCLTGRKMLKEFF